MVTSWGYGGGMLNPCSSHVVGMKCDGITSFKREPNGACQRALSKKTKIISSWWQTRWDLSQHEWRQALPAEVPPWSIHKGDHGPLRPSNA